VPGILYRTFPGKKTTEEFPSWTHNNKAMVLPADEVYHNGTPSNHSRATNRRALPWTLCPRSGPAVDERNVEQDVVGGQTRRQTSKPRQPLVDDSFFCQSLPNSAKYRLVIKRLGQALLTLAHGDSIALIPPNELVFGRDVVRRGNPYDVLAYIGGEESA